MDMPKIIFYRTSYTLLDGDTSLGGSGKVDWVDISKYPNECPVCGSPAYVGFSSVECVKTTCIHGRSIA